jgi:hypothetical protein
MICDASDIATSAHNGRPSRSYGGSKSPDRSPEEELGWAILEQAIDDLVTFCRWGLITPRGNCMPWPRRRIIGDHGYPLMECVKVATMPGPRDHMDLRDFFLDKSQGQFLADLVGMRLPMADVWERTLKHNCGREPR